ncbi:hypothetical protein [Sphingobium sp. CR28]|uniref:hypothetical protein n=1 Tax=Sphingobium sp. CR28 TaxID=3400272 RepID=UPI003FF00A43
MRMLLWILTVGFALGGLALCADQGFAGATRAGQGCLLIAALSCPLLWAKEGGVLAGMTRGLIFTGRDRLLLSTALLLAAPVILPWPF